MQYKKRKLYLIGAGEFGREIESWISLDYEFLKKWEIVGFLDHNLSALDNYPSEYSIVGIPDQYEFQQGSAALLCTALFPQIPLLKTSLHLTADA